jgi:hypothetical protein
LLADRLAPATFMSVRIEADVSCAGHHHAWERDGLDAEIRDPHVLELQWSSASADERFELFELLRRLRANVGAANVVIAMAAINAGQY